MIQAGCNPDQAYDTGSNDAMKGEPMASARWDVCEGSPEHLAEIKAAYRKGYETSRGSQTNVQVVVTPAIKSQCLTRFGQRKCGYDCKAAYGQVACGANPGDNCVEAFGQLRCGRNCRTAFGEIQCD